MSNKRNVVFICGGEAYSNDTMNDYFLFVFPKEEKKNSKKESNYIYQSLFSFPHWELSAVSASAAI